MAVPGIVLAAAGAAAALLFMKVRDDDKKKEQGHPPPQAPPVDLYPVPVESYTWTPDSSVPPLSPTTPAHPPNQ